MPLLKKRVFEKVSPQEFLRDDEEVFYCELTNEIFRNYEEFAERMLLCTSMVWTCAMSGKSNLTYEEALESEENARKSISEFPVELRIPILYVATKTKRTGFGEMAEDVFLYCKDRYFIGEKVESSFTSNKWVESHILQVIAPNEEEIVKMKSQNGNTEKIPVPPPSMYKYEIEHLDADDQDISEIMIVDHNQLRRRKLMFSREKCKLFLKQYVQQDTNMHWIIKPSAVKDFGIDKMKFDKIFSGREPAFDSSRRYEKKFEMASNPPVNGKKSRQETLAKYLTKLNEPAKMNGSADKEKKSKDSEAKSAQFLEEMEKRKEEYQRMKQQREVDQKLIASKLKDWNHPREDLQLEDQQPLPVVPELETKIAGEYIGDVIMVMEFIHLFSKSLNPKKFVQGRITMKLMERALLEMEVAGPLIDLIQMFLTALLREQVDEIPTKATFLQNIDLNNMSMDEAARFATLAANWSKQCQGLYLRELPLYSLTVSEVLRLHLLSSGVKLLEAGEKKRYYLRGGFVTNDDPGLYLRINKPHILKALAVKNVTQLDLKDKIDILSCLVHQLLTYPHYRDTAEELRGNYSQAKFKVKSIQREDKKREHEFNSSMFQLRRKIKTNPKIETEMEEVRRQDTMRKLKIEEELEESSKHVYDGEIFLGMDRAYRKYFKLESIPGVFIDSSEENPGVCLPKKVEQVPELVNAKKTAITKYLEKNIQTLKKKDSDDDSPTANGVTEDSPTANGVAEDSNGHMENGHDECSDSLNGLLMCSANEEICQVHSNERESNKWRLLPKPESLDEFISTLNKRGIRERELSQALQLDKTQLVDCISKTPGNLWGQEEEEEAQTRKMKKTYIEANFGFPPGTSIDEILQNTLTDEILELDEKICTGYLGRLRVKNREEWRNALAKKDYKNFPREINRRGFQVKEEETAENDEDEVSEEAFEIKRRFRDQDPGAFLGPSRENEPENDENEMNSSDSKEAVECLAIALVQVAHSIEPKFLEKPIGNSDYKKLAAHVPTQNRLEKWENSLLLSTSFSQIFLHFSTLDASIMWRRSIQKAKCGRCNRGGDSENLLLCDNCNKGSHLYCLKPKLKEVPEGEWFCEQCEISRDKEERHILSEVIPKKKQRLFKEEENGDEQKESLNGGDSSVSVKSEVIKIELCGTCNSGGVLIMCKNCGISYHKECVDPPVLRVRENWICTACREDPTEEERPRVRNNNEKSSRRSRRSDREPKKYEENEENTSDSDNYPLVRVHRAVGIINNERRSATKARHTISNFVKSLRRLSPSKDDSDSGDSSKNISKRKRSFRRESGRDDLPLHNAALQDLLQDVMKYPDAWPFLRPVKNYEVPDYHDLISHPMDFGTIKYKLNMGEYHTDSQVMNDAALVFENCNTYNQVNSEIHRCGVEVLKIFRSKCEELGLELPSKLAEEVSDRKRRRKLY